MTGTYVLDNGHPATEARFKALEHLYDPATVAHLDAAGVGGRRCWEVGAGSGSVAVALAARGAEVVATDIDPSWAPPAVGVYRHDVTRDPPPGRFDLIHLRLVASHLPDWSAVLPRLVDALLPGGWLLVEELDPMHPYQPAPAGPVDDLINRVGRAFTAVLATFGGDPTLGRKLRRQLTGAGLVDTAASGFIVEACGGELAAGLMIANIIQTAPRLADHDVTGADVAAYVQAMRSPGTRFVMPTFWTARGRKPL